MDNISSLLLKLDRVGFLSFVSKRVLTKPPLIKPEGKLYLEFLFFFPKRGVDCESIHNEMMACLELEFALL